MSYIIDTNIVTAILKKDEAVIKKLEVLRTQGKEVFISCITYYEIKRGLLAANATRQLSEFSDFCRKYRVILLDNLEVMEKSSEIYADLKRRGRLIQDADILIAATAITGGLILVSNDYDLSNVEEINLENWLKKQ
jgi:tRNA(fMet)-specific endonuclease VapC